MRDVFHLFLNVQTSPYLVINSSQKDLIKFLLTNSYIFLHWYKNKMFVSSQHLSFDM